MAGRYLEPQVSDVLRMDAVRCRRFEDLLVGIYVKPAIYEAIASSDWSPRFVPGSGDTTY